MALDLTPVVGNLPALARGGLVTLELSALAIALATGLGTWVGLMGSSSRWLLKAPSRVFVDVIRGTPLLVQMYVLYYGFPSLGIRLEAFTSAVIALGVNSAAYIGEIVRASIQAVPGSQIEAAKALGMSQRRTLWRIVAPQAMRVATPPITGEWCDVIKWSSVASVVVVGEITHVVSTTVGRTMTGFIELFLVATVFYLVVTGLVSAFGRSLERYAFRYGSGPHG